ADDALAEHLLAVGGHALEHRRVRLLAADDLEEVHVAHGVEEVGDAEALAERGAAALQHVLDLEAGGVRGDDGARLDELLQLGEELLLGLELLDDDLDDPVALLYPREVLVDAAGLDELGVLLAHEGRGLLLEGL